MPKRTDIRSILIIGAGPIIIGQGCEFDYSGTQACKALREDGYRLILVNSNPATIMTDPDVADATYVEPIHWAAIEKIIEKERPDALLPTMGGQTALNCALDLVEHGVLERFGVQLIGAQCDAIKKAEDRSLFRDAMVKIGLAMPKSIVAKDMQEAFAAQQSVGFPTIIRPSFTLGGSGGGIAYNVEEFEEICARGFSLSPVHELLIEESIIGWKEYEMEVVRDKHDNTIIVCTIENFDPMGVHTGDSITVAPAQTLTDKEHQVMRDAAIAVLREIGVETGGSNVQFAVNPKNGQLTIIEMNPRVSRSSALASKATGFPIAKVAAKLAVGYTLDELKNEITGGATPASFEPTLDYVIVKIPRFNFEKFPNSDARLTTQMKSVGEVMGIGRNFQSALQKAIRSLEVSSMGFEPKVALDDPEARAIVQEKLSVPQADRLWYIADAFRLGYTVEEVHQYTKIDAWYLVQIEDLIREECALKQLGRLDAVDRAWLLRLKKKGFSDVTLSRLLHTTEDAVRARRLRDRVVPVYKRVDTCGGEFRSDTAYLYSCYESICEARPTERRKIMILGSGPNRIGQGVEFDYCCVHAALAFREAGFETIMVNCNPETVSTDYDTSDRLYFEALTLEDVLAIVDIEQPEGVVIQYGGQTPLKLAKGLAQAGVRILGTSPDSIDLAEDRARFKALVQHLGLKQPENGIADTVEQALAIAGHIGYPLVARPSYVLGGRAMEVIHNHSELIAYFRTIRHLEDALPILLDKFLDDATEVDVDGVGDGKDIYIGGIMEHIEQAGVHSGDSSCTLPPYSLSLAMQARLSEQLTQLAQALHVVGLVNGQFAIQGDDIYVLEINPRASRTIPFISKTRGVPLAKVAARAMIGISLSEQDLPPIGPMAHISVKHSVFPFIKFTGVDPILGPELRSTGEVMGVGTEFGEAFAKSVWATGLHLASLPRGQVFISVRDADKPGAIELARRLIAMGFKICATKGTYDAMTAADVPCHRVHKVREGRPHIVDHIKNKEVVLVINTTEGRQAILDSNTIRSSAIEQKVWCTTTLSGARALVAGLEYTDAIQVFCLQNLTK
ncbi:MAG: carbamoyl-phosphate synthase large subunit [Pseudomonadota bacterium]